MHLCAAKVNEWIEILFGVETLGAPRNIVLDGTANPPRQGGGMQLLPNYFGLLLLVLLV